jgi:NAD+ synthase
MSQDEVFKNSDDFTGRDKIVFEIYKRLNVVNKHKMLPIPVYKIKK